ncbi:MAG: methyltransferase domain-containing protein, partial [Gammaproteobacteria bacterium]|nr:methyltransferase domain-containing protein [Gammaproteobacteria bacterium]
GAKSVVGIDTNREYIAQARSVFPEITFRCEKAEDIYGSYDIIIASALLHYIADLDNLFEIFSRCAKQVICDIWIHPSQVPIYALTDRNIFIPSKPTIYHIVSKYFSKIEEKGIALSPDNTLRQIFHISEPRPKQPEAVLISGPGRVGKTTLASTYFKHKLLHTDTLSAAWIMGGAGYRNAIADHSSLIRGRLVQKYVDFLISELTVQLTTCINRDIVLEGNELGFSDFKVPVIKLLNSLGWQRIIEINKESL